MQKHIFNEYDIRGVIGKDLQISEIEKLTHAIVTFYQQQCPDLQRIAVAMDGRVDSPEIYQKVSQVIMQRGLQVYFLGSCPTSVFLFGLHRLPVQAGIMITASYLPKDYNGFKLYLDKQLVWGKQLQEIYEISQQNIFATDVTFGKIVPCPIINQYIEHVWQEFGHLSQYDFSLVIDCAHGVSGPIVKKIVKKMGWQKVRTIHDHVDGTFPDHDPHTAYTVEAIALQQALTQDQQSFGIVFDGDATRMIGMTQQKEFVLGDTLLALFAQDVLQHKKGGMVVHDVKCSQVVQHIVDKYQGVTECTPSGSILIHNKVMQTGAVIGGDINGNYFFNDRHPGYSDGIYAMLRLLDMLVKRRVSLYELLAALPVSYDSQEFRIPCDDISKINIVEKVRTTESLKDRWNISLTDGVRLEKAGGWGVIRPSRTESLVSIRYGAKSKDEFCNVKKDLQTLLQDYMQKDVIKKYFD